MTGIENPHSEGEFPVSPGSGRTLPRQLPTAWCWFAPHSGLLDTMAARMQDLGAHPARTVVLLPYAQLLRQAQVMWATHFPDGFAPRFETSMNWSASLAPFEAGPTDIRRDKAADTLTARALLKTWRGPYSADQVDVLAALMVKAVHEVAPMAAACAPDARAAWAQTSRVACESGWSGPGAAWEAIAMAAALEWAASSRYATDVLFSAQARVGVDCVLALEGLSRDPLLAGLQPIWGAHLYRMPLVADSAACGLTPQLNACVDAAQEAERVAANVLAHVAADRYPLALICSDRALTRRIQALLDGAGAMVRDETGWMLSTTHAGAAVTALLRASVWNASSDAVLAWLKLAPALAPASAAMEVFLRRYQLRDWREVPLRLSGAERPRGPDASAITLCVAACDALRQAFSGRRSMAQWLAVLELALRDAGIWDTLNTDAAGLQLLALSGLDSPHNRERLQEQTLWGGQALDAADFSAWMQALLEGNTFRPDYPAHEQVVLLPMSQILARPFAAVVLAGCDEIRLPRVPESNGLWTPAQRLALGLPERSALAHANAQAFLHALDHPHCDIFWRTSDDAGESIAASPLVRALLTSGPLPSGLDQRSLRPLASRTVQPPQPSAPGLMPVKLSQSAYEDLRNCPYRFFAQRQLGLYGTEELESEVDKRDFGQWLHRVLEHFERAMQLAPQADYDRQHALLESAGVAATQALGLDAHEFLPFAAAWRSMGHGYLAWRKQHVAAGMVFDQAEAELERPVGRVNLTGRIDRLDRSADGASLILDYKTESPETTRKRVKQPLEDTQMAFYAALHGKDDDAGAYLSFHEREGCKTIAQSDLLQARDALVQGIHDDMESIAAGALLPALGEGETCDFCKVRGLCRKDFWAVA
jgi:ATP-dependent helicase/nuclease subunit B